MMFLAGGILAVILSWQKGPYLWEGLNSDARDIETSMRFNTSGALVFLQLPAELDQQYDSLQKDMAFRVLDEAGIELFSSAVGPALTALRTIGATSSSKVLTVATNASPLHVWQMKVISADRSYSIQVARSQRLASILRVGGQRLAVIIGFLSTTVVVLIFACFVLRSTRGVARNLREISEAAAALGPCNLAHRLDGKRLPSELTPLIEAFNTALERLETGYRVQQEFLASAAHELKTPLALLRAEIEMESSDNRDAMLKDIDVMARQVHQLLQLAEVSEVQNYAFERLDLVHAIEDAVTFSTRLASQKNTYIDLVYRAERVVVTADKGAIFTLAKNLIENAIHHSPYGERVTIEVGERGFIVRDKGPGVAQEDVPKLFSRFWRSTHARHEGAGLGLSICKEITTAHQWTIFYLPTNQEPGAEFHVVLH